MPQNNRLEVNFWTCKKSRYLSRKTRARYSSEDLERFDVEYQSEWVPRGMTMRVFCDRNPRIKRIMVHEHNRYELTQIRLDGGNRPRNPILT